MRTFCYSLVLLVALYPPLSAQTLTPILLPRYMEGINGTNANRIPFAYRVRLAGLSANATYRYFNQVVTSADAATANGAGNCIFVPASGSFTRTSGPGLATAGAYGTFLTDGSGTYEGWFVTEPTGNARFTPATSVFMRIALNDGAAGTTVALRLTTSDSVSIVKLGSAANDSTGTALRGRSSAPPRDFVFVYDNTTGTGRPISGSYVESDGTVNSVANSYAVFYAESVDSIDGAYGVVVPNSLPNGIRRVERRSLTTGAVVDAAVDADGMWPSGANTVNPSGGTTAIFLTGTDATLPIRLSSFNAVAIGNTGVRLNWNTLSEVNTYGFNVMRRNSPEESFSRLPDSFVPGHGTTLLAQHYTYVDNTVDLGHWFYRLEQIDLDGTSTLTDPVEVDLLTDVVAGAPMRFVLSQNYPNPFNPTTTISFSLPSKSFVSLKVFDALGREVSTLVAEELPAGTYARQWNAAALSSGVYFYRLQAGSFTETKRLLLLR